MLSVGRIFIKPVKVDTVCGFSVGHLLHKIIMMSKGQQSY